MGVARGARGRRFLFDFLLFPCFRPVIFSCSGLLFSADFPASR
jgi:hypothetical protein